jgi:NTP pyrophosphatase (non-canonical NTP hydrolase)
MADSLEAFSKSVVAFRDRREWRQFHQPKDLAISIALEAAELLEHFQWKTADEAARYLRVRRNRDRVAAEMADILILLISLADVLGEDLMAAARRKLKSNDRKYPVARARGTARKYHALRGRPA